MTIPEQPDKIKGLLEGVSEDRLARVADELLQLWAGQVLLARPPFTAAGSASFAYVSETDSVRDIRFEDVDSGFHAETESGAVSKLAGEVHKEFLALLGSKDTPPPQVFVGRYWPAPSSGTVGVRFYQAPGTTVMLMDVLGNPPPDPTLVREAASALGKSNLINFVKENSKYSELAYVHNELKDKGKLDRQDQAMVATAIALDPLGLFPVLLDRAYDFVEMTNKSPGKAPLEMASSPTRPAGGFILQFPPSPVPSPVCVMSPTYIHTPRDPGASLPIFMRPEMLVLKVY